MNKKIFSIFVMMFLIETVVLTVTSFELDMENCELDSLLTNSIDIFSLKKRGEAEGWTFTVDENFATNYSLDCLCGYKMPDNWWVDAIFDPCIKRFDLPEKFSWLDLGGCTPIKTQYGGTCWAFSVVAPLECNILIKDGLTVDLSEQWLISCTHTDAYCFYSHWYHLRDPVTRKIPGYFTHLRVDPCGDSGAVLEADFPCADVDDPYKVPCNCPYSHPYKIESWAFIGHPTEEIPDVDAIKQAIFDYGPISACVWAGNEFQAYDGGVFNFYVDHSFTNHATAIVGWDDTQGENGVWIIRNSWGPDWGENGYMRIEYGCSNIGRAACYVNYQGEAYSDEILALPNGVVSCNNELKHPSDIVYILDLNKDILGIQQSILVKPLEMVNIDYKGWCQDILVPPFENINPITQHFATYSWNKQWPPYDYHPLYDKVPPEIGEFYTDSWTIQAPQQEGEYSIWICGSLMYNMEDAVNNFIQPPTVLPHGKIIVRQENLPPNKPSTQYNKANDELLITSMDPEVDQVRYGVSWDNDNVVDKWTNFVDSGTEQRIDCEGRKGTLGVIAEDEFGAQSDWVSVTSKSRTYYFSFFARLIQRFPFFEKILK